MDSVHSQHISVMPDEVLNYLQPSPGGHYIDGTAGGGGHTAAILERSAPEGRVLGIDTDEQALDRVRERLSEYVRNGRLVLVHGNFADLTTIARQTGFTSVQGVLLDLGFSSDQMDNPQRGFSFSADGPLDMRLDRTRPVSAADLVNSASEQELADIFWRYGEERRSRQIARRIVNAREKGAITRTTQLAALVAAGVPFKPGTIHPATRVFQALRIAVNQELEQLTVALPSILDILNTQTINGMRGEGIGRMAVIAFHSLEDRIVKEFMRQEAKDCICPPRTPVCICGHKARLRILTPRPLTPTEQEVEQNPRARSAKLRVAEAVATDNR
ncbi:ribosomal RNA small subunit methyltransferase H [Reticulibacter mediterranei]|uniref:Ribosomal RNA small subunit methyltransferase H n=1 Tax=Reticulibacter mediterranei TaxID=2778369 RepID=A0A8J3II28_9CHLR|nr:16S rRNA (cytosine(1402)-N(4))-methyltransferase RsmH [Reticulibacter mediterranei]GHO92848.1 ribosomal RNA small subunit methyltransferase H [Reticulibacter mediterranei]